MADNSTPKSVGAAGLITTGLSATTFAGACVTLATAYIHWKYNLKLDESTEQALQTFLTTIVGGLAMTLHVLIFKLIASKGN